MGVRCATGIMGALEELAGCAMGGVCATGIVGTLEEG